MSGNGKRDEDEAQSLVDVEYMPTLDFFHRHTRPMFWLVEYLVPFGNNVVFRWLFGWALPPKSALIKWINEKMARAASARTSTDIVSQMEDIPR